MHVSWDWQVRSTSSTPTRPWTITSRLESRKRTGQMAFLAGPSMPARPPSCHPLWPLSSEHEEDHCYGLLLRFNWTKLVLGSTVWERATDNILLLIVEKWSQNIQSLNTSTNLNPSRDLYWINLRASILKPYSVVCQFTKPIPIVSAFKLMAIPLFQISSTSKIQKEIDVV